MPIKSISIHSICSGFKYRNAQWDSSSGGSLKRSQSLQAGFATAAVSMHFWSAMLQKGWELTSKALGDDRVCVGRARSHATVKHRPPRRRLFILTGPGFEV